MNNLTIYPSNIGKPWSEEEIIQLLKEVQKKIPIDEIAILHKRTYGGIHARLKHLAIEYHYNDKRPIEQIMKFTGLSEVDIKDSIRRHKQKIEKQTQQEEQEKKIETIKKETGHDIRDDSCFSPNSNDDINIKILNVLYDIKHLMEDIHKHFGCANK